MGKQNITALKKEALKRFNPENIRAGTHLETITGKFTIRELTDNMTRQFNGLPLLDVDPPFQRGEVYTRDWLLDLMNTIMENGTIPHLTFGIIKNDSVKTPHIVCVDGKQRLTSIQKFTSDKVKISGLFKEEGGEVFVDPDKVINKYIGLKFSQLPKDVQNQIWKYQFSYVKETVAEAIDLINLFQVLNGRQNPMKAVDSLRSTFSETGIGKAIEKFIYSDFGKNMFKIKKPDKRSAAKYLLETANYLAAIYDFSKSCGITGAGRFLNIFSDKKEIEIIPLIENLKRTVLCFNKCFGKETFEVFELKKDQTVAAEGFRTMGEEKMVKEIIFSVLGNLKDHNVVFQRKEEILENLKKALGFKTALKSELYDYLTVQTNNPSRRQRAMEIVNSCFEVAQERKLKNVS